MHLSNAGGRAAFAVALLAAFSATGALAAHDDAYDFPYIPFDHPAIQYLSHPMDDPVARLQKQLEQGKARLEYQPNRWGYLPSLLKLLGVNTDSQMLVFSKTSFQGPKISPKKPRGLYFNDHVAVGFVQDGDVIELISVDPMQGVIFYTLDIQKVDKPSFLRRDKECLNCHLIPGTLNVPGLLVTSVIPSTDGSPRFPAAALLIDHRSPLDQRWGGWYVTGTAGGLMHRGNAVAPRPDQPDVLDRHGTSNLTSLSGRFDTNAYLAPTSDIVALMTLEHQTRMTNLMTRLGWETRIATQEGKLEQFRERLDFLTEQLVAYMLFAGEAHIYEPIQGVSTFAKTFPARGPHDKQGRSLRDFDLENRLFRYPLSYMIYSEVFESLPPIAKERIYHYLYNVLTGKENSEQFARLSTDDRRAVLEIVRDTKPNLPAYWNDATQSAR